MSLCAVPLISGQVCGTPISLRDNRPHALCLKPQGVMDILQIDVLSCPHVSRVVDTWNFQTIPRVLIMECATVSGSLRHPLGRQVNGRFTWRQFLDSRVSTRNISSFRECRDLWPLAIHQQVFECNTLNAVLKKKRYIYESRSYRNFPKRLQPRII